MIASDRKEAARLFKNDDATRAQTYVESSLRNNRIVAALTALSPLSNALYQRSEPLAGYTSLIQIPEPARSGIVTIVFAASRLQMGYLTETVAFLREQFGSIHINQIQQSHSDFHALINSTVREALSAESPSRADIDKELASAVKEYFGVTVLSQSAPQQASLGAGANGANGTATTNMGATSSQTAPAVTHTQKDGVVRNVSTPLSVRSSELGAPVSPQLHGVEGGLHVRNMKTPSPPTAAQRGRMYGGGSGEDGNGIFEARIRRDTVASSVDVVAMKRGRSAPTGVITKDLGGSSKEGAGGRMSVSGGGGRTSSAEDVVSGANGGLGEGRKIAEHLRLFEDNDKVLLCRYEILRAIISV